MQPNVCLVFNDFCGSIDCFNEASFESDLPTIVLDCEGVNSNSSHLVESISYYLQNQSLQSFPLTILNTLSSLLDRNHNAYQTYIQSLSNEALLNLFFSLLKQYPIKEIPIQNSDHAIKRSAVVLIKTSFHCFNDLEYQVLDIMAKAFPQVLFILSVNDVQTQPSVSELSVSICNRLHCRIYPF